MFRLVLCVVLVFAASVACVGMEDVWEKPITVDIEDMDIREALKTLFKDTGLSFSIARDVVGRARTVYFKEVPFRQALDNLAKSEDLVYSVENNVVTIRRKPGYDPRKKLVNLEVRDTPLADALETLLGDAGINYTIDPSVNDLKVTAVLRNVNLKTALKQVLKAAGAVQTFQNDTYSVKRRPSRDVVEVQSGPVPPYARPGTTKTEIVALIVALKYLDPGEIAPMLVKPGRLEVQSVSGGKPVLRGSEEALQEAKTLIRALDDESALARPVRIKLAAPIGS